MRSTSHDGLRSFPVSIGEDGRVGGTTGDVDLDLDLGTAGFSCFVANSSSTLVPLAALDSAVAVEVSLEVSLPFLMFNHSSGFFSGPTIAFSPTILIAAFCSCHQRGTWRMPIWCSFSLLGISCL